jgi:hypothetical protein
MSNLRRRALAAADAAEATRMAETKQYWIDYYLSLAPHIEQEVARWAANFEITVSDFQMSTASPSAKFTGTTADGVQLSLNSYWESDQNFPTDLDLAVWLRNGPSPAIYLYDQSGLDRAISYLNQSRRRKRRKR